MRWPWQERRLEDAPPVEDLKEAVRARQQAERQVEASRARRDRVNGVMEKWDDIRRRNHLAEAIRALFEGR